MKRVIPALLAGGLVLGTGAPSSGQSLTSVRGLGYPLLPVDARTEVLGGLGLGLKGLNVALTSPASVAGVGRRGAVLSVAASEQTAALGDRSATTGATRFPLVRVLVPTRYAVLTASYGGYLDQAWGITSDGVQTTGTGDVAYTDVVRSQGGLGQFEVGAAIPIGNQFALGVSLGRLTGSQQVDFRRTFDDDNAELLQPFDRAWDWQYSAPVAKIGARWDPNRVLRLGASVAWAGTLEGDPAGGVAEPVEFELPLQVAGGTSAYLSRGLLATVSGRWSGWSSVSAVPGTGPVTATATSRDTWELGAGLELDDPTRRARRSFPLRLGFQYRQLPFSFEGEAPTEWFAGAGLGLRFGTIDNPLARVDLGVQRGERSAALDVGDDFSESTWRVSLTMAIFGT